MCVVFYNLFALVPFEGVASLHDESELSHQLTHWGKNYFETIDQTYNLARYEMYASIASLH